MQIIQSNLIFTFSFFVFITIATLERILSTFLLKNKPYKIFWKWSTVVPFIFYIGIVVVAIIEYFIMKRSLNFFISFLGLAVFIVGAILRNWAIRSLAENWNIHIDADNVKKIVDTGPYKYLKHPYYLAVIFELTGVCLIINAFYASIIVFLIQLPLLIMRIILEERVLIDRFGTTYKKYVSGKII